MTQVPPCERCGRREPKDMGSGFQDEEASEDYTTLLLGELSIAPGTLTWMCHSCRKEWKAVVCGHSLWGEYAELEFKLEFWKETEVNATKPEMTRGMEMFNRLGEIENEMTEFANRFLGVNN